MGSDARTGKQPAPNWYGAIWRWHFYAGLFCVPFILWLSCTGALYLWKPQIEAWTDRPYAHVADARPIMAPSREAAAAVAAVPGSIFHAYELKPAPDAAARVIVGKGDREIRVYVHPNTLRILKTIDENKRLMQRVFRLHGELMLGRQGSWLVELAASWTIVLILTGLYLWWPRRGTGLAGIVYPRLRGGKRVFWRDMHAVTGAWVSLLTILIISAGLPWAASWGSYLRAIRSVTGTAAAHQDWSAGSEADRRERLDRDTALRSAQADHAEHGMMMPAGSAHPAYAPLDRIVPEAARLGLPAPVLVAPDTRRGGYWTVKSNTQNRPLRTTLTVDSATGRIVRRVGAADGQIIDRVIGYGVAAHEGQLFGLANQIVGLLTAIGLILLSVASIRLWWRRRTPGVLGAPPIQDRPRLRYAMIAAIVVLAVLLPLFGLSLIAVLVVDPVLRRLAPRASAWLGTGIARPVS